MTHDDITGSSHDQDDVTSGELPRLYPTHLRRYQREQIVTNRIVVILLKKINMTLKKLASNLPRVRGGVAYLTLDLWVTEEDDSCGP